MNDDEIEDYIENSWQYEAHEEFDEIEKLGKEIEKSEKEE